MKIIQRIFYLDPLCAMRMWPNLEHGSPNELLNKMRWSLSSSNKDDDHSKSTLSISFMCRKWLARSVVLCDMLVKTLRF